MHRRVKDVYNEAYCDAKDKGLSDDSARWHADVAMQQQMEMEVEAAEFNKEQSDGR